VDEERIHRRLARELRDIARGATIVHRDLRDRLLLAFVASLALDLIAGAILSNLTYGHGRQEFGNYWTALFWATTQLLTISSQLSNPHSTGAHIVDVLLEVWAMTVVTAVAGSFAAFFHHRTADRRRAAGEAQSSARG
jgi:hypothetical protein